MIKNTLVYILDTNELCDEDIFNRIYDSVSDHRKQKVDKLRYKKDKRLSLGAEYLLMRACSDCGIDYKKTDIITSDYGKPIFKDIQVYFNLSHSGNRAMCIISDNEVGCDVEIIHDINMKIAKRYFFENEYKAIEECTDEKTKKDLFFRYWTLKESFMKCTGLGFRLPLNEFNIVIKNRDIIINQNIDDNEYIFKELNLDDDYKYAYCIRNNNSREKFKVIHVK